MTQWSRHRAGEDVGGGGCKRVKQRGPCKNFTTQKYGTKSFCNVLHAALVLSKRDAVN